MVERGQIWRHVKRGSTYTVLGVGTFQSLHWIAKAGYTHGTMLTVIDRVMADQQPVVLYQANDDSSFWVRPLDEFEDGRFVMVAADG